MKRHFEPCSMDFLQAKIVEAITSNCDMDDLEDFTEDEIIWEYIDVLVTDARFNHDRVVAFDTENVNAEPEGILDNYAKMLGFRTLKNGLTYLGVVAYGDWEAPVFMMLYWDGKGLRMYIPEKGNTYNTDTMQAYGNDAEADCANAAKKSIDKDEDYSEEHDEDIDVDAMLVEINAVFTTDPVRDSRIVKSLLLEIAALSARLESLTHNLNKELSDLE